MPDGIIVVIALFVLAVIVAVILPVAQRIAEPKPVVDSFVDLPSDRGTYIRIGEERYNKFSDSNDITKGNFRGADNPYKMFKVNQDLQKVSQTADMRADPGSPTYQGVRTTGTNYTVAPPSALLGDARRCEAKKGRDACAALGSADMKSCGVCIKGGTAFNSPDAEGKHIGGLLILDDDREMAEEEAPNDVPPNYKPTLGECPDGYFFVSKDECVKAANRLDCKEAGESGGFDGGRNIEGKSVIDKCAAAPLSGDTTYVFDTKDRSFDLKLRIIPPAGTAFTCVVSEGSEQLATGGASQEYVLTIPDVNEGAQLDVKITEESPYVGADGAERRAVLLQWEDESGRRKGSFESSLVRVNGGAAAEDGIFRNLRKFGTFSKSVQIVEPRAGAGSAMLGTSAWMWGNLASSQSVVFGVKVPGTFMDPVYPEDASIAPRGPLITQKSTMELLRAGPCMKPDQKPGKYGAACLKALFVGSGGDFLRGKLVSEGLEKLNRMGDGSAETIAGYLSGLYTLATKGKTPQGRKGTLTEINDAAMKMFGFELVSPCEDIMEDADGNIQLVPKMGSLDADCLDYLWTNTGNDRPRGLEDRSRNTTLKNTYTYIWDRFSGLRSGEGTKKEREASPFAACQRSGTLAPKNSRGQINTAAMYEASTKGSVSAVQDYYNKIHQAANYKGNSDETKAEHAVALEKCYGIRRSNETVQRAKCATPPLIPMGSRVSLKPASDPFAFARHAGFVMWSHRSDGSPIFRNDATFKTMSGIAGTPNTVSFQSVNFPSHYLTYHSTYRMFIAPIEPSARVKAEWNILPALNGNPSAISLEARGLPTGWYMGRVGNEIRLVRSTGRNVNDLSWSSVTGLA